MAGKTFELQDILTVDQLASGIADQYRTWDMLRNAWKTEKKELRDYIFATSTNNTTNSKLPWKNSTTTPKLCQIRDNLHANYMAALFPNDNWLVWEGHDESSELREKRTTIENYMRNKLINSDFETVVSNLVYDYIDYGNVVGSSEYVLEKNSTVSGDIIEYVGPKALRISPYDIVFNPIASDFKSTPKIVRTIMSIGDLKKTLTTNPEDGYLEEVFDKLMNDRSQVVSMSAGDVDKTQGFQIDGFSSIQNYYGSQYVELLEMHGDYYDIESGILHENRIITVGDQTTILRNIPNPSWLGKDRFQHAGWRLRPDNLYAMGPLDNLVGMQYRIDHLENLKADVFDMIAVPFILVKGEVEEFEFGPGERGYVGDEGTIEFLRPDTTALNADTQIAILEQKMEEMAGAPRQAMGIRTPGEKTKFEVQTLENSLGRIFQDKTRYFEKKVIEPLVNQMLEQARRNLDTADTIRILDTDVDVVEFETVTKEDITAKGKLRPIGARHFAQQANMMQNLIQFAGSPVGQDPAVNVHISGFETARLMEQLLEIEPFGLVSKNIRVFEAQETEQAGAPISELPPEEEELLNEEATGQPLV